MERVPLRLSTVEYALKRPDVLKGMPEAGIQSRHRVFSLPQARKLTLACHLVMVGIPLKNSVKVLKFVEAQIRATNPEEFGNPLTFIRRDWNEPWRVEVFDCRLVRVWCGELHGEYDARYLYLDLKSGKTVKLSSEPDRIFYVEIDLSELERRLMGDK